MKKTLALVFTVLGAIGLIAGIVMMFTGQLTQSTTWIAAVLGIIFFSSGIGLLKTTKGGTA